TNDSKRAISSLDVRTLNGRKLIVTAAAFVLCCGGIESPRILLNCTRDFAHGLGNQHDLVGRFFMDHLSAEVGAIVPQIEMHDLGPFQLRRNGTTLIRGGLMNSAETVRQAGRRGCGIIMFDATYDDLAKPTQSPSYRAFNRIIQFAR